jgi:ABC-type arginine transport system permease subunit
MIFYYLIIAATLYLIWQSWVNYRIDKIENKIKDLILFTSFKYRK